MKNIIKPSCLIGSMLFILAGCYGGTGADLPGAAQEAKPSQADAAPPDNELFIFTAWPAYFVKEENFERQVGQFIKKKFPDIKVKHVAWDNPGRRYEDLIAAGTIPDIVFDEVRRNTYRQVRRFKMEYDMTDLIKKYNFDTSKLNPADMQHSINTSDGKLYSLPFNSNEYVLIYNKDIFDKFGADYPQDGMTWDEAYEMAKKLTRQEGDITYKGFQMNPAHYLRFNQLSEPGLDPSENKASMVSGKWTSIVDNIRRFYDIPGNQLVKTNEFTKGRVAMIVDSMENVTRIVNENPKINFDVSSVPVFPEAPKSKFQPNTNGMFITKQSDKKDLAFQVIAYLLSPEVQIEMSKQGVMSPLMDPAVQQAYGSSIPEWRGKHVESLFALNSAKPPLRKPGLTFINENTDMVWNLIATESKDSQTALRMTNESMNKAIEETIKIQKEGGISDYE
ncbi:extracellular solute-binding protein [Paenibacillus doosanensis]|uniref:Sn-glycerol-3-phosphate-binding periplasmic protein UgpB n=1 Tax=Paenibacillus konkukensis TaxID=2020716 RepID=A0ABY4RUT0_9BACL|nr:MULTISPECIES: extracellular solute-binding protein [Paenibacillus]MCS7463706.1 extracellular solute-binding protein [Paenibacillus doosanensis]UQZ85802.1 sn-glycerol-3-phosphate-binding periplasmic protein UgpB precursor [Paenibacillus konkukensis]